MRWLRIIFLSLVALLIGALLHYVLPQNDLVRITQTESVREDFTGLNRWFYANNEDGTLASGNRDIRFINAVFPDRLDDKGEVDSPGRVMVYRNEDTGFGWPPYFKFDTADLQAEATNLVSDAQNPRWVVITHYGWRMNFPTVYPNAVSIREVDGPDVNVFPWINIAILVGLVLLVFMIWRIWERFEDRVIDPFVDAVAVRWAKMKDWSAGRR